ncbi:MAG TPA: threonine synthase [Microscillaceae bacterium]|nr:threonine synthase [Microscillaceae bacterium]
MRYISNKGGVEPVDFETAILDGFAADGGLYVPEYLPKISREQLKEWANLSYVDLAFEILSLFIERTIISETELRHLLSNAYGTFSKEEVIPLYPLKSRKQTYVMELFHGPTISFKDIGLAFLVNLVDFFLQRRNERLSIIVATTGDTGPATAYYAANKPSLDAWVLYPKDKITEEQERQMTTLGAPNVHPVGVYNCPDGADDLDVVIAKLYANQRFKEKLRLSSVNSINWGRVMMQTVHYFYGYLQIADEVGEPIDMAVPSGAFGNLCAGSLARMMGLPVQTFICANNRNACLHRIFSTGVFSKQAIIETPSSAIDILIPYNFWRYLYFATGQNPQKINHWMQSFAKNGIVDFQEIDYMSLKKGFLSYSVTDTQTISTIQEVYQAEAYLLDPHGAVAVAAADTFEGKLPANKLICLATAHPAKFPTIIKQALGTTQLPQAATHERIEAAKKYCQQVRLCEQPYLEEALIQVMERNWEKTQEALY